VIMLNFEGWKLDGYQADGHSCVVLKMVLVGQKIEVNVNMHCEKCKTEVLKAVTKLSGINEVSVNLEKQMLVVIGDVDPVCVVKAVRKTGKIANITSVGPPKKPDDKSKTDTCAIFCPPPPPLPCYSGFYPAGVVCWTSTTM
ncbi:heavy metal-associated isoprenylated plant protein 2-like protein, partial [Tanacetum coccineum]